MTFRSIRHERDRLLPSLTLVYDVQSSSGAALPQLQYRYTDSFSVTIGLTLFFGRAQLRNMDLNPLGPADNRVGKAAYQDAFASGLGNLRNRDEIFARLRYTF